MQVARSTAFVALFTACLLRCAGAQPEGGAEGGEVQQAPPEAMLGLRVETVRRGVPHIPVVVLVPDGRSLAHAIGQWRLDGRFPVLIDDGSAEGAEHIARFVRAYAPERVVRWSSTEQDGEGGEEPIPSLVERVIERAWAGAEGRTLGEAWQAFNSAPPGVVVAREDDPAWVAAAALGAGRGQPVIWIKGGPSGVDRAMSKSEADALASEIEAGCAALGYGWGQSWSGIGDAIEAVTLCAAIPARIKQEGEFSATTDRIGRSDGGAQGGNRWAWAGQIFGSQSRAAYQAMCSLFLPVQKAWLFDGYPSGEEPWDTYDLTKAGRELEQRGIETDVHDKPTQSASHWRTLASRPLETDLVLVNTRGFSDVFNLAPGPCRSSDVPVLSRPVLVHFVHSWSAQRAGDRRTIAGRWLERGAYAYFGSTHEPYLQAFVPPPALVQRLYAPAPFGVAARHRPAQLWKLAYFGDPLITPGPPAQRVGKPLPLEGAADLDEELKSALGGRRYGDAARSLLLQGRDADVVRLAQGVLKDEAELFGDVAPHVVLPAFRQRDRSLVARAMSELSGKEAEIGGRQDALWNIFWPRLSGVDGDVLRTLASNIRVGNQVRDAVELAQPMADALGREEAIEMLSRVRSGISDKDGLEEIDAEIAKLGG